MKMKNRWKTAFFALLIIILALVVWVTSQILISPDEKELNQSSIDETGMVGFLIRTNKQDVNMLINHYLEKEVAETPLDYKVVLDNEVELYGAIPFFSQELNMKMTFDPITKENGDLQLRQKSISVGQLQLPVPFVLDVIRKNYKLPKGVEIVPDERLLYIHMKELKLKSDAKLKANTFDLKKDDISFTLLVPVK